MEPRGAYNTRGGKVRSPEEMQALQDELAAKVETAKRKRASLQLDQQPEQHAPATKRPTKTTTATEQSSESSTNLAAPTLPLPTATTTSTTMSQPDIIPVDASSTQDTQGQQPFDQSLIVPIEDQVVPPEDGPSDDDSSSSSSSSSNEESDDEPPDDIHQQLERALQQRRQIGVERPDAATWPSKNDPRTIEGWHDVDDRKHLSRHDFDMTPKEVWSKLFNTRVGGKTRSTEDLQILQDNIAARFPREEPPCNKTNNLSILLRLLNDKRRPW